MTEVGEATPGPDEPGEEAYARLAEATLRMRDADPGPADAGPALARVVRAPRRSGHVLAHAPGGAVRVARHVVVAALREAIDAVPGVATARVDLSGSGRETLTGVTVDVLARYGTDLVASTEAVHRQAGSALTELLGRPVALHVRVVDVVRGDPETTDPALDPPGLPG
jgi:hypothetical protein